MQEEIPDQFERYPMAPDIIDCSETIEELEYEREEAHEFLFEPSQFCKAHGELKLVDYKMSDNQLHS